MIFTLKIQQRNTLLPKGVKPRIKEEEGAYMFWMKQMPVMIHLFISSHTKFKCSRDTCLLCLTEVREPSWSWSYGSWIYNYLSPLTLWVRIPSRWGVLDTALCLSVTCCRLVVNASCYIIMSFVVHLISGFDGTNENHDNWYIQRLKVNSQHYKQNTHHLQTFLKYHCNNRRILWVFFYLIKTDRHDIAEILLEQT
jgi:hypothetical protein